MAINLTTVFKPYTDELFSTESKKALLTNNDFDWTGAHTVKVYKIGTSAMNDYSRNPVEGFTGSRYGTIKDLDATTEEFTLKKDRSFTFAIDKLDTDETHSSLKRPLHWQDSRGKLLSQKWIPMCTMLWQQEPERNRRL